MTSAGRLGVNETRGGFLPAPRAIYSSVAACYYAFANDGKTFNGFLLMIAILSSSDRFGR
jgi:hypothetical protein